MKSSIHELLPLILPILGLLYLVLIERLVIAPKMGKGNAMAEREIRRAATKKWLLGLSRASVLTILTTLSSVLVAYNALQLSIVESMQNRLYNEISVKPNLTISFNHGEKGAGFTLVSNGLGPAIIKWAQVSVDGKPVGTWKAVAATVLGQNQYFDYTNPARGAAYAPGDTGNLFWVSESRNSQLLIENQGRIGIVVCYCSVYEEVDSSQCWEKRVNVPITLKPFCEKEPTLEFPNGD